MNKIIYIILLLVYSCPNVLRGQNVSNSISGTIYDQYSKPLVGVEIILFKVADSTIIRRGYFSDSTGKFIIQSLNQDKYFLKLRTINSEKKLKQIISIDQNNTSYTFDKIIFDLEAISLVETTVKAVRPLIERQIDKTIINVSNNYLDGAGGILRLLQIAPGVTVGSEGDINVNGNSSVTITLNNKQIKLTGSTLKAYLTSLNVLDISQIEIMTNPSAKYDAEGTAAIINIVPKKIINNGTNLSAYLNYGYSGVNSSNFNFNYNRKINKYTIKFQFFNSIDPKFNKQTENRTFISSGGYLKQDKFERINTNTIGSSINIAKTFSDASVVSVEFNLNKTTNGRWANQTSISNIQQQYPAQQIDISNAQLSYNNIGLTYKKNIDSLGGFIEVKADYWKYNSLSNRDFNAFNNDTTYLIKNKFTSDFTELNKILTFQLDVHKPSRKGGLFESGLKVSNVNLHNNTSYHDLEFNLPLPIFGGNFNYFETILASYVNKLFKINNKTQIQTGIRFENTTISTYTNSESNNRTYLNLFPSLFIRKQFDSLNNNVANISYTKRISRPKYYMLNPIPYYNGLYSFNVGDFNLLPGTVERIELTYVYKKNYSLTTSFENYKNEFSTISYPYNIPIYSNVYSNLSNSKHIGLAFNIQQTFKNLTINSMLGGSYEILKSQLKDSEFLQQSITSAYFRTYVSWQLHKGISISSSYFIITPRFIGQNRYLIRNIMSSSISKKFKNNFNMTISIDDLFRLNYEKYIIDVADQYAQIFNRWNSRRIGLSLFWNFSKGERVNRSSRDKSNTDELIRNSN